MQEVTEKRTSSVRVGRVRFRSLSFTDTNRGHESRDFDMPCGVCPEGIEDKAFPPDSPARRRCFYATVRYTYPRGTKMTVKNPSGEPGLQAPEGGFTLIEVIVSMAILSITFVLIMQLFAGGLRASRTSCDFTRAVVHAKDKMEELSGKPVQESGEFEDGFKWETELQAYEELEETGLNLLKIKVKVSWDDALNKERSVELVGLRLVENEK